MSDDASGQPGGTYATGHVVRGGNREVTVSVDVVCLQPDGFQFKYELIAKATVIIPAGDPLPQFVVRGKPWTSMAIPSPVPADYGPFQVKAHTVCLDKNGNLKWEADTEPISLAVGDLPPALAHCNTVVTAAPHPEVCPDGY